MIQQIQLNGYRLLNSFSADLGALTVVIGANAAGKSTLIDAFQTVTDSVSSSLEDALAMRGGLYSLFSAGNGTKELHWTVRFSKPEAHDVWSKMPIHAGQDYLYEVKVQADAQFQPTPILESLRTAEPLGNQRQPFVLLHADQKGSRIYDHRQRKLVSFDEASTKPASQGVFGGGAASEQSGSPVTEKRSLLLSKMRFPNEFPQQTWVRGYLQNCHYYPGFDVGRSAAVRVKPSEIRPTTVLGFTGDNLGTVLHEILTRHNFSESAEMLREFLRTAYPFFENIHAETAFGTEPRVLVRLRERGIPRAIELWEVSDGVLRFLCLAAALLNPVPPALVAVDEPEAGLHPKLLPIVADMIRAAAEKAQVLVTTHSPVLLNCFQLDQIAVMVRDGSLATWYRPSERQSLRKMLESVTSETLGELHRSGELEALA